jgi:hypothetical protein
MFEHKELTSVLSIPGAVYIKPNASRMLFELVDRDLLVFGFYVSPDTPALQVTRGRLASGPATEMRNIVLFFEPCGSRLGCGRQIEGR